MKLHLPLLTAALLLNKDDVGIGTGGETPVIRTRQPMAAITDDEKAQRVRQAKAVVVRLRDEEERRALQEGRKPEPTPTLEDILATAVDEEPAPEPPAAPPTTE